MTTIDNAALGTPKEYVNSPSVCPASPNRDVRIDFVRGLALLCMFVEHVPGALLRYFTPAATCIASCTDAFILISGYVCGAAYSRRIERFGIAVCWRDVMKRCGLIYVAHVATLLSTFALLLPFSAQGLLEPPNSGLLTHAVTMQWMPQHFGILTVYIVLLSIAPGLIWLLSRSPALAFAVSGAVYLLFQAMPGLTELLSEHGPAAWINPLAWQALYAIGAWLGVRKHQGAPSVPERKSLLAFALLAVLAGAAWKMIRFTIHADVAGIGTLLDMPGASLPLPDKINLSPLRFLSALACGYVGLAFLRRTWRHVPMKIAAAVAAVGRHSLPIFCVHLGAVYVAQAYLGMSASLTREVVVVSAGVLTLIACGHVLSRFTRRKTGKNLSRVACDRTIDMRTVSSNA